MYKLCFVHSCSVTKTVRQQDIIDTNLVSNVSVYSTREQEKEDYKMITNIDHQHKSLGIHTIPGEKKETCLIQVHIQVHRT